MSMTNTSQDELSSFTNRRPRPASFFIVPADFIPLHVKPDLAIEIGQFLLDNNPQNPAIQAFAHQLITEGENT